MQSKTEVLSLVGRQMLLEKLTNCICSSVLALLLCHGCSSDEHQGSPVGAAASGGVSPTVSGRSGAAGVPAAIGGGGSGAASGVPATVAGGAGARGNVAGAGAAGTAGASGGPAAIGGSGGMATAGAPAAAGSGGSGALSTGTLPVMDIWKKGTWTVAQLDRAGPTMNANVFYPKDLGKDGIKHAFTAWGNGAFTQGPESYRMVTEYIASHGFVVYATFESTDAGTELTDGISWLITENGRSGSMFEGKLDTTKACSMGHSMGGLATFAIAKDPRLTTTVHISGGTMPTHETVNNLHAPALFVCGDDNGDTNVLGSGDIAAPNCKIDFMNSKVPTFYAEGKGLSHASGFNMMQGPVVGWMRWLLAGDQTMRAQFVGPDCGVCKTKPWVVMQKDLEKIP